MLAQGNGATTVTSHVAETYRLSRRQDRRITAAVYELLIQDLEDLDLSRLQMTAQLVETSKVLFQKSCFRPNSFCR